MATNKQQVTSPLYKLPKRGAHLSGVRWEVVVIGWLAVICTSWLVTQYIAAKLGYQAALGQQIAHFFVPVYQPFAWVIWGWRYGDMDNPLVRDIFANAYMGMLVGALASVLFAAWINYRRTRDLMDDNGHIHGSAHWATPDEVKATGLLGKGRGVYVGAYQRPGSKKVEYLRHDGPEHVMAFAPTRSGKGVGLILPTLLSWPESALIYDIKGENYALTAGWRRSEADNYTLKFEPTATEGSVCFNPLEEVRLGTDKEVADVQNLVTMIVDPDGRGLNDHWAKTGHALLVGAVLHVLYAEPDKTLAGVANFLSDPSRPITDTLNYMLNTVHDPGGTRGWVDGAHPVVTASARDMLNKSENEMSGVLSTAMSFLTLYRDPILAKNTAKSEFKVRDLMNAERPVSLYLVVPPSDKDRLKPLVRLVINQVVRTLTEKMEFKDGRSVAGYKHRLLLMLDEFPSLGKLDIFEEALAFIAGYGMKAYLIIQDISQLWTAYGKDESIFSNCHVRVAYAPNKVETAELLSKMTGTMTVVKESASYSGDRLQPMLGNVSTSTQEVSRSLLTPDEVMRLRLPEKDRNDRIVSAGDMLVFVAGHAPIYGKQILYFLDPTFAQRAKICAPEKSDRLTKEQPAPTDKRLDPVGKIPDPPQPPDAKIAASFAQNELATEPQAGSVAGDIPIAPEYLNDPTGGADPDADPDDTEVVYIEEAPDTIADPAEPYSDDENGEESEEEAGSLPPERDLRPQGGAVGHEIETCEIKAMPRDKLLDEMKALSADGANDVTLSEIIGMYDDILPPKREKSAGRADEIVDLNDAMADVLVETVTDEGHAHTLERN